MKMTQNQMMIQGILDLIDKGVSVDKAFETARHNVAQEYLEGLKLGMDTQGRMEELWEKANDSQRKAIVQLITEKFRQVSAGQTPAPAN
jgi:RIO-like serine/threonine protein kinase